MRNPLFDCRRELLFTEYSDTCCRSAKEQGLGVNRIRRKLPEKCCHYAYRVVKYELQLYEPNNISGMRKCYVSGYYCALWKQRV